MIMTNLETFNQCDEVSVTLNEAGREYITYILENYSNYQNIKCLTLDCFANGEFDQNGEMLLELSRYNTKTGNPHTYTLDINEHFDIAGV